jgi:hypothetical protein
MRGLTLTDDDEGLVPEAQCIGIGFASGAQVGKASEHEHSFKQVEPFRAYSKKGNKQLKFSSLFCECGITTEIVSEDKRPLNKAERKQLGL